ncbi:MAG TPA: wax ester/triacylglycerol synthase family O-acyltransferase [Candidatus Limnocylindria bacterium]|nr:wax ester/triacylglycerol synthase family O-acyltransferase [Candidatus Limnocylindria bacterium]
MPRYSYERLSAQDASFLAAETPTVHMHITGTQIFDAGPLTTPDGGIDFPAIKRSVEAVLHLIPRYRQRLKWIPFENHPVWVDDHHFNLDYHIRHTALPRPGSDEQLKRLCSRIMAQPLDRRRPLWEFWVAEGLAGNRFAIISKMHHCMLDGQAGADLAHILLSLTPQTEVNEPAPYIPRPSPTSLELFRDSLSQRLAMPLRALAGLREVTQLTAEARAEFWARTKALADLLGWAVQPASETPMNGRIGPHRRFDYLVTPLADVKRIAKKAGASVNDVVLAAVTGAVRDFLVRRRVRPEKIDFRVSAPVSVRRSEQRGEMGNHVSSWIVRLPIDQSDALAQLERIRTVTEELKRSRQALGVETMMAVAEWTPSVLLSLGARAASGPINMIVTNVPGPQVPLYLLGCRLLEVFPQVPLLQSTGVGVALMSFDGKLCWGVNADYELVPDLRYFVRSIESALGRLAAAVGVTLGERSGSVIELRAQPPTS